MCPQGCAGVTLGSQVQVSSLSSPNTSFLSLPLLSSFLPSFLTIYIEPTEPSLQLSFFFILTQDITKCARLALVLLPQSPKKLGFQACTTQVRWA